MADVKHINTKTLKQLAFDLFEIFSQFEYCLKVTGHCLADRGGAAKPNWSAFASALTENIIEAEDASVTEAVNYILSHPPKKQMFTGGKLRFDVVEPRAENQNDLILLYVRRVRNNLFHGGKFNGEYFEPDRSRELLSHSASILMWCVFHSDEIGQAYEHRADWG